MHGGKWGNAAGTGARIALLNAEVDRLKEAMTKKRASKDAANAFFKS